MREKLSGKSKRENADSGAKEGISINEIKTEFESEGELFTDEQLEKIRDFLYLFAQISYEQCQRINYAAEQNENCKIVNIQNYQTDEPAKSNIVYPCEYGRTG
jgi:hypothetical protein